MKKNSLIAGVLLLPFVLAGCINLTATGFLNCLDGSGNILTESKELQNFNSVTLRGQGDLFLTQADEFSVRVETDDNILQQLEVTVKGNVLEIGPKAGVPCLDPTEAINVWVTMKEVKAISINGSGSIIGQSKITSDNLSFNISGSGNVNADIAVSNISTTISGSGKVVLSGTARSQSFVASGSGKLQSFNLDTKISPVTISGSGKAEVKAQESLNATISGSGTVFYKGDAHINQKVSGSGTIKHIL